MLASGRKAQPNSAAREGAANGRRNGRSGGSSRYEVLERHSEGTLWIVYRVRERIAPNGASPNPRAGEILALKALKQVANRHPRLPGALTERARRWTSLSHPNLTTPREVNVEDDTLYFTTDWLPAPALEARLSRGPLPAASALQLLGALAGALAYLHERDLPHGDVRPRQVLFDEAGVPKLSDGGIAEAFADAGLALADVQPEVAHYMAPERSQGESLSAAADVYALGVCFYRMLCGRVPFDGASALAIATRHRNEAITPPSQFNERVSPDLDELALQLLEKDPAQRPTAADLQALLQGEAPATTSSTATGRNEVIVIAPTGAAMAEDDEFEPQDVAPPADATNAAAAAAMGPKRRPLDEVVAETMSQEAEAKRSEVIKRARRKHRWREFSGALGALAWMLIMVGGLGAMVYGAYSYWLGEIPAEVVVPRYLNKSEDDARALLAQKGLSLKVARESYDPKKPAGTVLAGDPQPGRRVRSKREVLVTVSAGSAPIKMVDFSRLSLDQARSIILQHGLRLGQSIEQFHPRVPRGYICGQYPDPGEPLRRSEPITLIVSRGPQPTEIDAQKGIGMDSVGEIIDPTNGNGGSNNASGLAALPQNGADFTPLEPAPAGSRPQNSQRAPNATSSDNSAGNETPVSNEIKTKRATIRVNVPRGGGSQVVRIVVRDSNGERTIYQRSRPAGTSVSRTVRATRPDSDPALVRVYVGDELVREDTL